MVQSTPITGVAITGTYGGTTNYSAQLSACPNTSVSLTAPSTAASGSTDYTFVRWVKDGANQTDGVTTLSFNFSAASTCQAVYTLTQRMLTVQSSPTTGVSITGTPSGTTNYSSSRDDNSSVTLTAPATITGKTVV